MMAVTCATSLKPVHQRQRKFHGNPQLLLPHKEYTAKIKAMMIPKGLNLQHGNGDSPIQ
jgi:hypothetical protein